jgi:hypothetical protein
LNLSAFVSGYGGLRTFMQTDPLWHALWPGRMPGAWLPCRFWIQEHSLLLEQAHLSKGSAGPGSRLSTMGLLPGEPRLLERNRAYP